MSDQLHSDMGPSSLPRRRQCPGSRRMEAGVTECKSVDAERGHDLHAVLAKLFTDRRAALAEFELLEPDDQSAVEYCTAQVLGEETWRDEPAEVLIEKRVDLDWLGCGWGTTDFVVARSFSRCAVFDWKFGWGEVDEAADNIQLAAYALGVAREYGASEVAAYVVQPMKRQATMTIYRDAEIAEAEAAIRAIVDACRRPDAVLRSGPACKYCRAAATCPELVGQATELAVLAPTLADLSPSRLAEVLMKVGPVEELIKAVKTRADAILSSGGSIPGWHLAEGRRTRVWQDEVAAADALVALSQKLGKPSESIYETSVASPAQIEKAWGKGKAVVEALKPLITAKPGNLKLERME